MNKEIYGYGEKYKDLIKRQERDLLEQQNIMKEEIEPIGYKFDTSINKPVLAKRVDNFYYAYPTITGWLFYRSRYLGEKNKEIIDIDFDDWSHKVLEVIENETKDLRNENTNLKQALNEIRKYVLNEMIDVYQNNTFEAIQRDILQIIDKYLGGSKK